MKHFELLDFFPPTETRNIHKMFWLIWTYIFWWRKFLSEKFLPSLPESPGFHSPRASRLPSSAVAIVVGCCWTRTSRLLSGSREHISLWKHPSAPAASGLSSSMEKIWSFWRFVLIWDKIFSKNITFSTDHFLASSNNGMWQSMKSRGWAAKNQ